MPRRSRACSTRSRPSPADNAHRSFTTGAPGAPSSASPPVGSGRASRSPSGGSMSSSRRRAVLAALSALALLTPAASAEARPERVSFRATGAAEAKLAITASAPRTDWSRAGSESAVLSVCARRALVAGRGAVRRGRALHVRGRARARGARPAPRRGRLRPGEVAARGARCPRRPPRAVARLRRRPRRPARADPLRPRPAGDPGPLREQRHRRPLLAYHTRSAGAAARRRSSTR